MLWEFPIWLLLWVLCTGLGLAIVSLIGRLSPAFRGALDSFGIFWLGLATLIGFLQLYSLALPTNGWAWVCAAPLALLGWVAAGPPVIARLRARFHAGAWPRRLAEAIAAVLILFVVANQALQPVTWWDTQTLHLGQARWIHEFRAPPGLGNLDPKLGFDSAEDVLAAFVEIGPWRHRSVHVLNGFLLAALLLTWLRGITRPATTRAAWTSRAFRIVIAGYVVEKLWSAEVPSLSTDLAMAIAALVVFADLLRVSLRSGNQIATLLAVAAACVAFKLSGLVVLVCVIPVAYVFIMRLPRQQRLGAAALLAMLPSVIIAGVVLRRIVLTGWLFYPAPSGNLHLSWSMPRAAVVEQYQWIKSWARVPRATPADVLSRPFLGWFAPWFDGFRRTHEFSWLCFGGLALLARHTSTTIRRLVPKAPLAETCAVVGALGAIAYWFHVAPDVRFGGVFFWAFAAAAMALPLALAARESLAGRGLLALAGAIGISFAGFNVTSVSSPTARLAEAPVFPTQDQVVDSTTTPPGVVHVPNKSEWCGDSELPCANLPDHLRWRRPGHLESGFLP